MTASFLPIRGKYVLKIGELSHATGTQIVTIRYYEREGLLPSPARTESNFRVYTELHLQRLTFIRHCRSLDMALDEIRTLLHFKDAPEENCGDVNTLLEAHIGHVAERIRELRTLEKQLKGLRDRCGKSNVAADCGILGELSRSIKVKTIKRGSHVHTSHGRGIWQLP